MSDIGRSSRRIRTARVHPLIAARYVGSKHRLLHKRSTDGSGKCNAFYSGRRSDEVIGVLYDLLDEEKPQLDKLEGLGRGYDEKDIEVRLQDGTRDRAITYLAAPSYIDDTLEPFDWYLQYVVDGAREHGLPEAYVQRHILEVRVKLDPRRSG